MAISVLELDIEQLGEALQVHGLPAFRTTQIAQWVYEKGVCDVAAMTNLSKELRETLSREPNQLEVLTSKIVSRADSADGTIKLLLEYADGERIECVLIPTQQRATACLSTQVGCAMGCKFCASGMEGFKRNLSSGEILQQVIHLQQAGERRVSHVVFMGMGEPLANYGATVAAVKALNDPDRFNISARHITVSTVGLPTAIRRLATEELPITLAISLHAPNDVLRRQLIPLANRYSISDIIDAATMFYESRHREITLEYVLLGGVNDTPVCAEALAQIAHRLRCSVNLIRYNPVPSLPYVRPTQAAVKNFVDRLNKHGVNVHMRRSRGLDAQAACGQLRRSARQCEDSDDETSQDE